MTDSLSLIDSAKKLQAMGPKNVIIKKGEHGAILFCDKNLKNMGLCLSQMESLGASGVLPLNASRRVSMTQESFSPYILILVPIVPN